MVLVVLHASFFPMEKEAYIRKNGAIIDNRRHRMEHRIRHAHGSPGDASKSRATDHGPNRGHRDGGVLHVMRAWSDEGPDAIGS